MRGEVLQFAVGAVQDISGTMDRIIAATSMKHDGADDGSNDVVVGRDNGGDAHSDDAKAARRVRDSSGAGGRDSGTNGSGDDCASRALGSDPKRNAEEGDAHRAEVSRDSLLAAPAAFSIESLQGAPSKYIEEPFLPPRAQRIRLKSNSSQADRDHHEDEKQKRASATKALEERHREKKSARKMEKTTTAVDILSAACAACPQVDWEK